MSSALPSQNVCTDKALLPSRIAKSQRIRTLRLVSSMLPPRQHLRTVAFSRAGPRIIFLMSVFGDKTKGRRQLSDSATGPSCLDCHCEHGVHTQRVNMTACAQVMSQYDIPAQCWIIL